MKQEECNIGSAEICQSYFDLQRIDQVGTKVEYGIWVKTVLLRYNIFSPQKNVYQRATKRGTQQNVVGPVSNSLSISLSKSALTIRYLTTLHLKQHKNFQVSRIQPQHSRVQILQPPESKMQTCLRSASDAVQTRIGATIDHFWT